MKISPLEKLPAVKIIEPDVFRDSRGHFLEYYQQKTYIVNGVGEEFVQDNLVYSRKNVLRGLHFQIINPQGKLVSAIDGEIFDVAVDIRKGSPTFGTWAGFVLSAENRKQVYIPAGFAHGYCVTGGSATVLYKCTDFYAPEGERGIIWNDPGLAIGWPLETPVLSDKDMKLPSLSEIPESDLPAFG